MKSDTTCSTPLPVSPIAFGDADELFARARSNVGVGSPVLVRWLSVREVVKPERAGLDRRGRDATHRDDLVGGRRIAVRAALAHDVEPHRAVRHLGRDVDVVRVTLDRVEVVGEALPVPLQAFVQRRARDVLDALHQRDQAAVVDSDARGRTRRRSCPSRSS